MSDEDLSHSAISVDTTVKFNPDKDVGVQMGEFREQIARRLKNTYESLPDISESGQTIDEYLHENPQSIIYVPSKDINMYPVILDEVEGFLGDYRDPKDNKRMKGLIRSHEFEHVQKIYGIGREVKSMGTVMFKKQGKPVLSYFVEVENEDDLSLRELLQTKLAPRTLAFWNDDVASSATLVYQELKKAKSWKDAEDIGRDVMFVLSERILPESVHSYFEEKKVFDK